MLKVFVILSVLCFGLILCVVAQYLKMPELNENIANIVTRSEWGARDPKEIQNLTHPVPKVIVHHSLMSNDNRSSKYPDAISFVKDIQNFHMDNVDRKWSDIGYSFLVGEDGRIYEGRGWNRVGAHSLGNNQVSIGICLLGDFSEKLPAEAQMQSTKDLIAYGVQNNFIQGNYSIFGHRDVRKGTECPGNAFYKELSTWPNKAVAKPEEIF